MTSTIAWSWGSVSPCVIPKLLIELTEMPVPLRLLEASAPWQPAHFCV